MARSLTFADAALADVREARAWYRERSARAARDFVAAFRARCEVVRRSPEAFGRVYGELRGTMVGKFPYVLVYEVSESSATVVAVMHAARGPESWRERLE